MKNGFISGYRRMALLAALSLVACSSKVSETDSAGSSGAPATAGGAGGAGGAASGGMSVAGAVGQAASATSPEGGADMGGARSTGLGGGGSAGLGGGGSAGLGGVGTGGVANSCGCTDGGVCFPNLGADCAGSFSCDFGDNGCPDGTMTCGTSRTCENGKVVSWCGCKTSSGGTAGLGAGGA